MNVEFAQSCIVAGTNYEADESADLSWDLVGSLLFRGIVREATANPVEAKEVETAPIPEAPKSLTRTSKKES